MDHYSLKYVLDSFKPISLRQMKGIKLMNRIDTKYITSKSNILDLLVRASGEYFIQEIAGVRENQYQTLYFDTPDREMFTAHHNGKKSREKIRVRTYTDSGISYFEIKKKDNKGRTHKTRIEADNSDFFNSVAIMDHISSHSEYDIGKLEVYLKNLFHRITLVNKEKTERLTIDYDISFINSKTDFCRELKDIAIIELKRDGDSFSPINDVLLEMRIHPTNFSKYCIGCLLTGQPLKYNRFKKELIKMDKLTNYRYGYTF